jgi:acyl transferase domain-containing protein
VTVEPVAAPRILAWGADDPARAARLGADLARLLGGVAVDRFPAFARSWTDRHGQGTVRAAVVAARPAEAALAVGAARPAAAGRRPIALMFPGQGTQHGGMATSLYGREPTFTAAMDRVFELLGAAGEQVRADWLSAHPVIGIDDVRRAQPLLFAVNHALGEVLVSWGVRPATLLGHSVGELVAATVAGVFWLRDAVRLLSDRVDRIAGAPPGGMLAVRATAADLRPYLRDDVVVAAVNGPRQTVLAGSSRPPAAVAAALRTAGFLYRPARATSAFHSPALAAAAAASVPAFTGVRLRQPAIPLYSAYTGALITPELVASVPFWAGQPAAPVLFGPTLDALLGAGAHLLVEAGAQSLAVLARRHGAVVSRRSAVTAMLPGDRTDRRDLTGRGGRDNGGDRDRRAMLSAAARIWAEGHDLDWTAVHRLSGRHP